MDLSKELVDLKIYERSGLYNYFLSYEMQRYSITVEVDVTPLYKYCKKHGKLNAHMVYAFVRACNKVENFKMRIENGKLYKYNFVHAGVIFATQNHQFRQGVVNIDQDIESFIGDYEKLKSEAWETGLIKHDDFGEGIIDTSCVKWYNFVGLCEIAKTKGDSMPAMTWDRVYRDGFKKKVHLAITMNHALVDGYHIGLLLEAIKNEIAIYRHKH